MIRGDGGKLYDDFRDKQVVAIGWSQLAPYVKPGCSREQLFTRYQELEPQTKPGTVRSGASQVWRFVNEMQKGDWAITYSPSNRTLYYPSSAEKIGQFSLPAVRMPYRALGS
ncbi:hypothetical protein ACSD30_004386, partial [Escherichia coli]